MYQCILFVSLSPYYNSYLLSLSSSLPIVKRSLENINNNSNIAGVPGRLVLSPMTDRRGLVQFSSNSELVSDVDEEVCHIVSLPYSCRYALC